MINNMWVVTQNRKGMFKISNAWLCDVKKDGMCDINIGYGATADEELWNLAGTYPEDRAKEVFEMMINYLGNENKFEMPKK